VKEVNSMIFNFVWNGKKPKLKRDVLVMSNELGGINVPDFSNMIKTSQVKWVKKFDNKYNHSWKFMWKHFTSKSDINLELLLKSNFTIKDTDLLRNTPKLYLDVLDIWKIIGNVEGNKESVIWYNECFKINKTICMYKDFFNVGIVHISDLFDVHGNPITFNAIVQKGVAPHRWLAWHSLLACVLRKKALVSKYKGIVHESDRLCLGNSLLCDTNSRKIYLLLHERRYGNSVCVPRISNHLEDLGETVDWGLYYSMLKSIVDTRTREFQFKFLHDIHVNNYWLSKWRIKDTDICTLCNETRDDISHMFWECQSIQMFLKEFADFLQTKFDYVLTKEDFFLGNRNVLIFYVIVICKKLMYQCNYKKESVTMIRLLSSVKLCKNIEYQVAKNNNKVTNYLEKWEVLLDL
jgi:hypothetical protein